MIEDLWNSLISASEQFVTPDWDELIALLPILLLVPVVLYVVWVVYRFATAGPTRRGKRRLEPVAPAGIHMPGPSFAPFLGAVGALFFVFGLVAGEIWLLTGGVILTLTLLYWGREALRDYDRTASASAAGGTVITGALPAPQGTPPPGVHMPGPSFRPVLVAVGATILVAGLVVGGWAVLFGIVALSITLVGWLLDSRREYRAVEAADRTGHLDSGDAPSWPKGTIAALAVIVAVSLVFSSGILGSGTPAGEAGAGASAAPGGEGGEAGGGTAGGGEAPASEAPALPDADVTLTAMNIQYVETTLTAPADTAFTIAFDNQDTVPHDVVIKDAGGGTVFAGEIVTGPTVVVYDVPAIPAGSYTYVCSIHPNMTGTLTVE
jgi:plastocyanin